MSSEVRALRAEIESLRGLVESLRITVEDLRERVEFSEQQQDLSQQPIRPTFSSRAPRATGSYSLVSGSSERAGIGSSALSIAAEDSEGRADLAREIGAFLKRAAGGDFRGSSGRSRLNLPNQLYVIIKDFFGHRLPRVRVVRDFATCSSICKRGPSAGSSVFVGFASEWEAKIALEEFGEEWPGYGYHDSR